MENSVWKISGKRTDEIKSNFNITNINKILSYGYKQKVNISMYHDAKKKKKKIYLTIIGTWK